MLDVARNAPYVRTIEEAIAKVSQNPSATALVRLSDDRAAKVNLTGKKLAARGWRYIYSVRIYPEVNWND